MSPRLPVPPRFAHDSLTKLGHYHRLRGRRPNRFAVHVDANEKGRLLMHSKDVSIIRAFERPMANWKLRLIKDMLRLDRLTTKRRTAIEKRITGIEKHALLSNGGRTCDLPKEFAMHEVNMT